MMRVALLPGTALRGPATMSPNTPARHSNSSAPGGSLRVSRRSLAKSAAWAIPVVTVASTAPALAVSSHNIHVTAGCLPNILGASLLPGFQIAEVAGGQPGSPLTLSYTTAYTGTFSYLTALGSVGKATARTTAITVTAFPTLLLATVTGITEYKSPKIAWNGDWQGDEGSAPYTELSTWTSGLSTFVSYQISRTATITGMNAGESLHLGRLLSVSGLPFNSLSSTVTVSSSPGETNLSDNSATIGWNVLSTC